MYQNILQGLSRLGIDDWKMIEAAANPPPKKRRKYKKLSKSRKIDAKVFEGRRIPKELLSNVADTVQIKEDEKVLNYFGDLAAC